MLGLYSPLNCSELQLSVLNHKLLERKIVQSNVSEKRSFAWRLSPKYYSLIRNQSTHYWCQYRVVLLFEHLFEIKRESCQVLFLKPPNKDLLPEKV